MDYAALMQVIQQRRSIRRFQERKLSHAQLLQLVEAAIWAPTGCNAQPWQFVIADQPELLARLTEVMSGIKQPPPAILCIAIDEALEEARRGRIGWEVLGYYDAAMAAQNLLLAAQSLGLGACVFRGFPIDGVRQMLGLPDSLKPELLVAVGYPLEEAVRVPARRALTEVVHWQKFANKSESDDEPSFEG